MKRNYERLFEKSKSIKLDLGCGGNKQEGFVGMDKRKVKGVDIVHDIQEFPWPIPDNICSMILFSHVWEHVEPKFRIQLMDEMWRILKPSGQLLLSCPYYQSFGATQDPTHYTCPNEATFTYFDPLTSNGSYALLYTIYVPKPWKLERNNYQFPGNMEVIMRPEKLQSGKPRSIEQIRQRRFGGK
jgi:SAM-dependent methyltransferase